MNHQPKLGHPDQTQISTPPNKQVCFFIPPYLLKAISESSEVTPEDRKSAANTLELDEKIRDGRICMLKQPGLAPGIAFGFTNQRPADLTDSAPCKVYDCAGSTNLPGRLIRRGKKRVHDRAANNAYDGLMFALDFFKRIFGRVSIDNNYLPLLGSIHFGQKYSNACWDGNQVIFGDGDGVSLQNLSKSLEVIVHEITHGMVRYTACFDYQDESGALSESIADVFACLAVQWHLGYTAADADWIVGKGLFPGKVSAIRSLKAPGTAYDDHLGKDPQVGHMDDFVETHEDHGGVHYNSGIPNNAFYHAAAGLGGYSWERAGQIWYKTLIDSRLEKQSTFKEFAGLTVDNALDQFGKLECDIVRSAWVSVGVL